MAIVLQATLGTLVLTSCLLIGTWIAFTFRLSSKVVGIVLAFGAGALISAVAYEMFPEASRDFLSFIALAAGALIFFFGTLWLERSSEGKGTEVESAQAQGGQAIVLGTLLDCIPECLVLGMSFAVGGLISIALFVSMLIATLPMTIGAASMMEAGGMSRRKIYGIWLMVMLICVISAVAGAILIQIVPQLTGMYAMATAAGALLAMLTVSMVPEALRTTGVASGLAVVFGFAFSAMLGLLG
jgi:zinc transporter, ZIP family